MRPVRWSRLLPWLALIAIAILVSADLLARVGGGGSYGGGGSGGGGGGGSSGGGGGDADLIFLLLWLCIEHPVIGIPLTFIVVVGWIVKTRAEKRRQLPASTDRSRRDLVTGATARRQQQSRSDVDRLLHDDANFSEILFLDFAQMLYTRYQEGRGQRDLTGLEPYLSDTLLQQLRAAQRGDQGLAVEEVIVGAINIERISHADDGWQISCLIEANYTEVRGQGGPREAYFSRGRLFFWRKAGVLSKGPDAITGLGCPSCGSPVKSDQSSSCAHCGQSMRSGLFHWELRNAVELERMPRIQVPLGGGGVEVGTDFPNLFDPNLPVGVRSFQTRYPGESIDHLRKRAGEVFLTLQQAWTSGRWEQARALETDRLFQMHTFWMDRYKARGWRNVLEDVQLGEAILVKLTRDAFLEIATLRIRASMVDYTVDRGGKVVDGQKGVARTFSEYWTFVRRAGFTPGQAKDAAHCPSCGAETKVAMNGRCEYCDAHLSSGSFDWTLAKIEQDEAYAG